MNSKRSKTALLMVLGTIGIYGQGVCLAGTAQDWSALPKAVHDKVLANGGKEGPVDQETEMSEGKAIFEASVKDKDGAVSDLDIREDGKLLETKHDDAADAAGEVADREKKVLAGAKFSHPREITNPWLPLSLLKQDVLAGTEDGKKTRVERTAKPDVHKMLTVGDQTIDTLAVEDREYEDGALSEVTMDYFAQDDAGAVYYLGEKVDEYKDGKVVGHDGGWMIGKETKMPGIILPGDPKIGDKFRSEDVSPTINEKDVVVSLNESMIVPAGTFKDCLKTKEKPADCEVEYKYYARGVGVIREVPATGDELLISHTTIAPR